MSKIGSSVLKKKPPRPHKISEAEIQQLTDEQERQKVEAEERQSETAQVKKAKIPDGGKGGKDERFAEYGGLAEQMNRPSPPEDEDRETLPGAILPKRPRRRPRLEGIIEEEYVNER